MKRRAPEGTPLGLRLAASFFLVGEAAPVAPATVTSFLLLPVLVLFLPLGLDVQIAAALAVTGLALVVSHRAERHYGHDASAITIDEVAGMVVTFVGIVPGPGDLGRIGTLFLGFFLFRVFDVVKPFPAGRAQHLPGGWGVVMDDVLAGVYANLGLRLLLGWGGWS